MADFIRIQGKLLEVKRAVVNLEPPVVGDNTIIAAVPTKQIAVLHYNLIKFGSNNVFFRDGVGGPQLHVKLYTTLGLVEDNQSVSSDNIWLFATSPGNALVLNATAATNISIFIIYVEF